MKKLGQRPTYGHPRVYHGNFLRFTETAKNKVYGVDTGTVKVAMHKLQYEFQYSSDKNKRSYASGYIIDLIVDNITETQYGDKMIDTPITELLPSTIDPSLKATSAEASTQAQDMEIETISPEEVIGYADSDRHRIYLKGKTPHALYTYRQHPFGSR